MRRELHQDSILLLEALERGAAILHDHLEHAAGVGERVEHAVDHREPAAAQALLDAEATGKLVAALQRRIVHIRSYGHRRDRLPSRGRARRTRVRADDVVELHQCDGGGNRPLLGVEGAQRLQPDVELGFQFGPQRGRFDRKDRVLVHHVIHRRPCRLSHEQLVEDQSSGIEVGGDARLGRVPVTLRRLVHRIEIVDNLVGDGAGAVLAGARIVEPAQ